MPTFTASPTIHPTITASATPSSTATPDNTPTPTNTAVPSTVDLIVGQPQLISTPPITSYEPIAFQVSITNTGDLNIETLFFVDLLFDPSPTFGSETYTAVSGLAGNNSTMLTITSTTGLDTNLGTHQITARVDPLDHILEDDETNNLSAPLMLMDVTPANTPIPTDVPPGTATISGVVRVFLGGSFLNQERMLISAIDETSNLTVATTYSDENRFYQFDNLTDGSSYTVMACITIDNNEYFGIRINRTAPNAFTDVFASEGTCP